MDVPDSAIARGGAEGDDQRVEVFAGRDGEGYLGRQALVRGNGVYVAGLEPVSDSFVERLGPSRHRSGPSAAVEPSEVVDDTATAEDEDPRCIARFSACQCTRWTARRAPSAAARSRSISPRSRCVFVMPYAQR